MKKTSIYMKFLSFILSLFLAIPLNVVSALAAATTTEIKHESPGEYYPGFRIKLDAEIEDDVGVMVARCYFKTKKQENFVFVNMAQEPDSHYLATLPAPWVNSESIDYVFVVVNKEKEVVRSQVFTIEEEDTEAAATWEGMGEVKEIRLDVVQEAVEEYEVIANQLRAEVKGKLSKYQKDLDQGQLDVNTELDRASEKLRDFYDRNVVVSEVPDHLKYGLLAEGLYAKEQIDKAGGVLAVAESTGAASAGSIKADDGGLPWGWIALGTVAVGGGVAAAVGSGGGGGGSHHDGGSGGLSDVTVSQQDITLAIWDDNVVDGDTIDLIVNGVTLLNDHVLLGPPGTTVPISLNSGNNSVVIYAVNEGGDTPGTRMNTAAMHISHVISGNSDQHWQLSTGETATMTISAP